MKHQIYQSFWQASSALVHGMQSRSVLLVALVSVTALFLAGCAQQSQLAPVTVETIKPQNAPISSTQTQTETIAQDSAQMQGLTDSASDASEAHSTETLIPSEVTLRRRQTAAPVIKADVPPVQKEGDTVKVAVLLPLSGEYAALGETLLNAAELALFQLGMSTLELLPRDTQGTAEGAVSAAQNALTSGAQLIVGPVFAHSTVAVAPVAQLARVKVLSLTTDQRVAGDGVFVMGFTPEEQVERILRYVTSQGLTKIAALVPDTPYGNKVLNAVNVAGAQYGAEMVDIVQYPPDAESLSDEMKAAIQDIAQYAARREAWEIAKRRLEQRVAANPDDTALQDQLAALLRRDTLGGLNYQALVLPESGARLRVVSSLLPDYDVDPGEVRLLGTGLWADPSLGREPALNGGWFAGPSIKNNQAFHKTFERAYGVTPPVIAALIYDTIALAGILAPDGAPNYTLEALTDPNGFAGSQGVFRLTEAGLVEHSLSVLELTPGGLKEIDPAPTSFLPLSN